MARPLSEDLRERAMARRAAGETVRAVADILNISPSCVVKWSQRLRATGSAAPAKMGGRKPGHLTGTHADWLLERAKTSDFTLRGLVAELGERGLKVDYKTVWTFIHAHGLSFKKKAFWQANRTGPISLESGRVGKDFKARSTPSALFFLMKPPLKQIWRPCGDGSLEGKGYTPRFPMGIGKQ